MENIQKQPSKNSETEAFIAKIFAEKKGREVNTTSSFTGFVTIDSPLPDLRELTASMLSELTKSPKNSMEWARNWDKSIISIAPGNQLGFSLLPTFDKSSKSFIPVATTRAIDSLSLISNMPESGDVVVAVNAFPMTIDAFLISYFHLVNEYIWDRAAVESNSQRVTLSDYEKALNFVCEKGFSVGLLTEAEIMKAKSKDPLTSVRVYGSNVNSDVPRIMGAIINK